MIIANVIKNEENLNFLYRKKEMNFLTEIRCITDKTVKK